MSKTSSPICILIAAMGGQGGGVLANWLVEAAQSAGYPAQATSIPGVAQRTGATTYYFELYPEKDTPAEPVFSLFPDEDGLDLLAAMEPMEAARAVERGLITRRTTVITSHARLYSTAEKSVAGDGTISAEDLLRAVEGAAGHLTAIDLSALAREAGTQSNAVLFGAIAATGILPLTLDECRSAVAASGVAVEANLRGFDAGANADGNRSGNAIAAGNAIRFDPAPDEFNAGLEAYPRALRPLIGHALARLTDYQDTAYARLFLEHLSPILEDDKSANKAVTAEVARRLAAWMAFDDVIRVAELKTRAGRFTRIRDELGIGHSDPLGVTEYLRPGRDELIATLPPVLSRLVPEAKDGGGISMRISSYRPFGFLILRLLAALKGRRRGTARFAKEHAAIEVWLDAVRSSMQRDVGLAEQVAKLAVWARGYGRVRTHGFTRLETLFANWNNRLEGDLHNVALEVDAALKEARDDPDGECAKAA
ncbi:MAG: indolepyruvate oxidoreductase subunit beta family protein [Rhodospirillales bacterium]|nr:indolepyruvate oxidoreductase subunit beta family protein [Rhodospirillales bacterium]